MENTEKINSEVAQAKIIKPADKQKNKKKTKKLSQNTKYFDYYDDIKSSCHKIYDW